MAYHGDLVRFEPLMPAKMKLIMEGEKKYTKEELEDKLNEKQKIFCHKWIIDYNNVQSYLKAYPDSSYKSAAVSSNELLKNPNIKQYIDFIKDDIAKEANVSKLSLINELKLIAFSNLPSILNKIEKDGLESLTEDEQKVVSEFDITEEKEKDKTKTKLKAYDKRGAIQDILKAMGWNEAEKSSIDVKFEQPLFGDDEDD